LGPVQRVARRRDADVAVVAVGRERDDDVGVVVQVDLRATGRSTDRNSKK